MKNVFMIPTCCREDVHYRQLKRCIESIRKHHDDDIILINDGKDISSFLCNNVFEIKTLNKGSADQQVFKIFLGTEYDKMIYIQDSMVLLKKLPIDDVDFKFMWYFSNHIKDWDRISHKPIGQDDRLVKNHTQFLQFLLDKDYVDYKEFYDYASRKLYNKREWVGCFGSCCIITKEILRKMEEVVPFVDIFVGSNVRIMRCANESIFSIIAHYCYPEVDFTKTVDGLYWDGDRRHINRYNDVPTGFDGLNWCAKNEYIGKISFLRY